MIANYLHILTFSRHRQSANLRALAQAAKQLELITFGAFMRVPRPSCPAKDNAPTGLVRFAKLFAVRCRRFRGRLNLHEECDWNGLIREILVRHRWRSTIGEQFLIKPSYVLLPKPVIGNSRCILIV